jgi:hypothetical protein
MKKKAKPDISSLMPTAYQSKAWAPPPDMAQALDPVLRANLLRPNKHRTGPGRVLEWLTEQGWGGMVSSAMVARWMQKRYAEILKESK